MLFSIITVCFNSEKTIVNTLDSVLNQKFTDYEYIIIDGKSRDGTLKILREYERKFLSKGISFHILSESDHGIYDAMNKGIKMAKGKYVALLNSDDTYETGALDLIASAIEAHPGFDIYHGMMRYVDGNQVLKVIGNDDFNLKNEMIEHPATFISSTAYKNFGLYDTKYRLAADYDLMLKMKASGAKFFLVEHIIANYSVNGSSMSIKSKLESIAIRRKHGCINFLTYIFQWLNVHGRYIAEKFSKY